VSTYVICGLGYFFVCEEVVDGVMLCEVEDMMDVEEVDAIRRTYPLWFWGASRLKQSYIFL